MLAGGRSFCDWARAAVVLGVALVVVVLRRVRRPREEGALPDEVTAEESARLDAAIRELETEEEPLF